MPKYIKYCKLERCRKKFETTRRWKDFCCQEHQKEYWNLINKERRGLFRRVTKLEKRVEKLENK